MSFLVENYDMSAGDSEWTEKVSVTDGAFSFQVVSTSLDASDSIVKVQYSNDNSNYSDVPTLSQVLPSGSNQVHFDIVSVTHRFYKVVITVNSVTTGTLTVIQP